LHSAGKIYELDMKSWRGSLQTVGANMTAARRRVDVFGCATCLYEDRQYSVYQLFM